MSEEILEVDVEVEIINIIRGDADDAVIGEQLSNYHENDIASTLSELTVEERHRLYRILGLERMSEVFAYLEDVSEYLEEIGVEKAADVIENMDADDAIDVLEEVDEEQREKIIALMDEEAKEDIELIASYEDDEIGSMMTTNYVVVPKSATIKQAMKAMIEQAGENDNINTIYVIDEAERYCGAIELRDLIRAREYAALSDIISTEYPSVGDHDIISEKIEELKSYAEDSIPVVDSEEKLLGVITSVDIVEAVDDEMGDDYAKLAGLSEEEDVDESVFKSMQKRMPWLVLLFFLGLGVSTVVGLFESIVAEVAVIVSFQSLILGMAGNVGTQSLAVTIRVLMDEEMTAKDKFLFIFKEVRVGFTNGVILGSVAFAVVGVYMHFFKEAAWGYAFSISGCVGGALVIAMLISGFMGAAIPMFFHKIKVDPAVASGPLISTVNDLIAVVTYYSLANILLIQIMGL